VKPAPFRYFRPDTADEALELLAEYGSQAKLLAGGQSLIPTMNFRLSQPAVLIDLNRLGDLAWIEEARRGLKIGAMTRQRAAERSDAVRSGAPLLSEAIPFISHPQVRNRGTIGGSLAHADPAAELPALMVALDAQFLVRNRGAERRVPAADFYTGLFATALAEDEMLLSVEVPKVPKRTGWAFEEISRRHGDYALVGVATTLTLDRKGRCDDARIVLLSVGEGPVTASEAVAGLKGQEPTTDAVRLAAEVTATRDIDPPSDIHASSAYRRQLARVLTSRALTRAAARARGERGSAGEAR
jgi:CO/xanthine dehydrogenase FAD-binding subunit